LVSNDTSNANFKNNVKLGIIVIAILSLAIPIRLIMNKVGVVAEETFKEIGKPEPLPPEWVPVVNELKSFVENERGLKFKEELSIVFQPEDEFREGVEGESEDFYEPDSENSYIALKALNLVDGKLDLEAIEDPSAGAGVVGYYDPVFDELYIMGTEPTPFVREVLVHELTHALQDQHFDIDRWMDDEDESYTAYASLVEGDATRIENRYVATMSPEDQASAALEMEGSYDGPVDRSIQTLAMLGSFPYEVGEGFATELFDARGQKGLDDAFKSPPVTTEQVLHTERFLAREKSVKVPAPKAEAKIIEKGIWGERGLLTMMLPTIDPDQARQGAEGWAGDYYVAWKRGGTDCIRMSIATDTAKDKTELYDALKAWSLTHPTASVTNAKTVLIRACA
jgi:hypothetical protein